MYLSMIFSILSCASNVARLPLLLTQYFKCLWDGGEGADVVTHGCGDALSAIEPAGEVFLTNF
jgi:hypothetical protein